LAHGRMWVLRGPVCRPFPTSADGLRCCLLQWAGLRLRTASSAAGLRFCCHGGAGPVQASSTRVRALAGRPLPQAPAACDRTATRPPRAQAWLPARAHVRGAIERRLEVDGSGEIFRLDTFCPWKAHLYELEEELALPTPLKFCIYEVCRGSALVPAGSSGLALAPAGSGNELIASSGAGCEDVQR